MSTPAWIWRATASATATFTSAVKAASSSGRPKARSASSASRDGGLGKLPQCVVRIRSPPSVIVLVTLARLAALQNSNSAIKNIVVRLVTCSAVGGPRAGALLDGRIVDAGRLLGLPLRDVQQLLEAGPEALDRLREASPADAVIAADEVRLLAPVLRPPTIRDFAAFEVHVRNAGRNSGLTDPPDWWYRESVFYFSNPLTTLGPDGEVWRPRATRQLDYEVEVAAVIGREGSDLSEEAALDHVGGFVLYNDWSARELCVDELGTFGLHKGKDFAQALGPWLLTTDEVADRFVDGRLDLGVWARVNGETWTESSTRDMHWSYAHLVSFASRDSRVVPGDVIGSGTVPFGCIFERPDEMRWLEEGDVVEIGGERLGSTRHTVRVP